MVPVPENDLPSFRHGRKGREKFFTGICKAVILQFLAVKFFGRKYLYFILKLFAFQKKLLSLQSLN